MRPPPLLVSIGGTGARRHGCWLCLLLEALIWLSETIPHTPPPPLGSLLLSSLLLVHSVETTITKLPLQHVSKPSLSLLTPKTASLLNQTVAANQT